MSSHEPGVAGNHIRAGVPPQLPALSPTMDAGTMRRPRNIGWARAAALLYGDWGTSKAYVIGIGFALLGYSAVPHFLAVALLTAVVGVNYIWICKHFPNGGGVYSSARAVSRHLAVVGALMLVADFIITASLSCLEAFHYFGFDSIEAKRWAILAIFAIAALNFFGPKHTGSFALWLAAPTILVVLVLIGAGCLHLDEIRIEPPSGGPTHNWVMFVGIILALSGVEAIASTTGVMRLDPGATPERPSVHRTSRKAILVVMIEVVAATAILGLLAMALPPEARANPEALLRTMGELWIAPWFGVVVGAVFGLLLLSAVNTAIGGLVSVLYALAHDGELPRPFAQLNAFGVPWVSLITAAIAPVIVLDVASPKDGVQFLASLYAIGVVGAITINIFSTAWNRALAISTRVRCAMFATCLVMAAIWFTIAATKLHATLFMAVVLALGFALRAFTGRGRVASWQPAAGDSTAPAAPGAAAGATIMVAARGMTPAVQFAIEEARLRGARLVLLYIRQVALAVEMSGRWQDDPYASGFFEEFRAATTGMPARTVYSISSEPAATILDAAATLGADFLVLGGSNRAAIVNLIRGNVITEVARHLPASIKLIVVG